MRAWTRDHRPHPWTRDDFDTDAEYEAALEACTCDDCLGEDR